MKVQPRGVFLVHTKEERNGRQFDLPATGRKISPDAFARKGFRRCVHWCLLHRCALESSSGSDFGESSGSISDRRDDSNPEGEKEKGGSNIANSGNNADARHCTCARAHAAGRGGSANTDRPGGREKGGAQPEHCLDATKSKSGDSDRTGASRGRVASSRLARRKEASSEKAAATCCANGGGEHFGACSGVAFSGTIHGNQRAFT